MYKWICKLLRIRRVKDVFTPSKAAKTGDIEESVLSLDETIEPYLSDYKKKKDEAGNRE